MLTAVLEREKIHYVIYYNSRHTLVRYTLCCVCAYGYDDVRTRSPPAGRHQRHLATTPSTADSHQHARTTRDPTGECRAPDEEA